MKMLFIIFTFLLFLSGVGWYFFFQKSEPPVVFDNPELTQPDTPSIDELPPRIEPLPLSEPVLEPKNVLYSVPFTSQAPTGEWGKSEFQNGCEEASVLMVRAWRNDETLGTETVKRELLAMARFEEKLIGQAIDTDAKDTAELLLGQYAEISDYQIVYDFTLEDLKIALLQGVVIVPANGQALKNPNFTSPGPLQHMLVIIGYDPETKMFVTNDPGTRKGAGYQYSEEVLFAAIEEYPTGNHLPVKSPRKAMIIVPEKF